VQPRFEILLTMHYNYVFVDEIVLYSYCMENEKANEICTITIATPNNRLVQWPN